MASLPVVKDFDIVKELRSGFLPDVVVPIMNQFHLEGVEETFSHRVIPTIPLPTHTALGGSNSNWWK